MPHSYRNSNSSSSSFRLIKSNLSNYQKRPVVTLTVITLIIITIYLIYLTPSETVTEKEDALKGPEQLDEELLDNKIHRHDLLEDLVIVPGHSIYTGSECSPETVTLESTWALHQYQKENNQLKHILEHIEKGVQEMSAKAGRLLVFSGGQTRADVGAQSEAQSYYRVARALYPDTNLLANAVTEEYARDSLENVLFSVCRFKEITGKYPRSITVVGFELKRQRFQELHRVALRFPPERFYYVASTDNPEEVIRKKEKRTFEQFQNDLYGCKEDLYQKRVSRDPFHRWSGLYGYVKTCPEMESLLLACSRLRAKSSSLVKKLPWESNLSGDQ